MVDTSPPAAVLVLVIVNVLPLFSPSIVTLSAPLRSTSGPAILPVTAAVLPGDGRSIKPVYNAPPVPLPTIVAVAVSIVVPVIVSVTLPWWVPVFIASKAAFKVV